MSSAVLREEGARTLEATWMPDSKRTFFSLNSALDTNGLAALSLTAHQVESFARDQRPSAMSPRFGGAQGLAL